MLPSTPDVLIQLQRADHPQVVALLDMLDRYLASLYPPEANHLLSVAELLAPEVAFFAAWQGERIVGTGAVRHMPGSDATAGQPYGELKRMFVEPALRAQGIAYRLVLTLEAELRAHGVGVALLETGRDQPEAVRLYRRCGYQVRGPFGGYPANGLSVFLEKRL